VLFQVNDLLARIKDQLFYVVLGFVLPIREYGYIQWAKNWSMYPYTLTVQNVMAVTFPAFSRLQDNKKALTKGIELSIFWITVVIFPILIGMALFIYPLLTVFSAQFGKWLPAVPSFAFFSLSIAWSAIATPLTNLLSATGKINRSLALMVMWTTLTWTVTPLFVRTIGFNGVALAAFVISFSSIAAVWMVKRELPIALWPATRMQLLAALAMAIFILAGYSLWQQHWVALLLGMIGSLLVYGVVLLVVAKKQLIEGYRELRS
jgi:O-antigen/teichoic acid export membrane protein